ncbi:MULTISPECIES: collagen-like protein [Pseudomonas]|uniref:collagen-like triple helix repeat-containing protein n=1 Tax=Pseudomonas TaxID=286 RepID=UPI0022499B96|nr:collagen-like protein [Pseudomonas sp. DCB_BG]MCX2710180.1 collagen-like protein [Pseudomonas sp. DCB_BG]
MSEPNKLSLPETSQRTVEALSLIGSKPMTVGEYTVSGEKKWSSPFLTVGKLVFEAGAVLVFDVSVTRKYQNILIVAEEIVSKDQESLGEIRWADLTQSVPPSPGYGSSGQDMAIHTGATGGQGGVGPAGIVGEPGYNAPSLTIMLKKLTGGLKVNLKGEDGGAGGVGGIGGAGGQGGRGSPASQNLFNCMAGAGDGGTGGSGGVGGAGGAGGNGGNGGTLTLISELDAVDAISRLLVVDLSGGVGGAAGQGGEGGSGGPGGPGGQESKPYCVGNGDQGPGGAKGPNGSAGIPGAIGQPGAYYFGGLSIEDLGKII